MPSATALCAYDANRRYARDTSALAVFAQLSVMPCAYVDAASTFCTYVQDQQTYMIIAGFEGENVLRRRLLAEQDAGDQVVFTRNPDCQLAMAHANNTAEKKKCMALWRLSASTVSVLNASAAIAACAFCSRHDFLHELLHNPHMLPVILSTHNVAFILQRHTILNDAWKLANTIMLKLYLMYGNSMSLTLNQTVVEAVWSARPMRRLLGTDALLAAQTQMLSIHNDYAAEIASAFNYQFNTESAAAGNAWQESWPPSFTADASSSCSSLTSLLDIIVDTANKTKLPYTAEGRAMRRTPARTLKEALPSVPPIKTTVITESTSIVTNLLHSIFAWFGIRPQTFADVGSAFIEELANMLACDIDAVQVCSQWRVKLLHSVILMSVLSCIAFVWMNQLQVGFMAMFLVLFFGSGIMFISYGYSPLCVPMVPICFGDDLLHALQTAFPKVMYVPTALLHTARSECAANQLKYNASCIRSCREASLEFDSWQGVLAWTAAEAGFSETVLEYSDFLLFVDNVKLRRLTQEKRNIMRHADADLQNANRLCAILHAYELLPAFFAFILVVAVVTVLATFLPALIYPMTNVFTALVVSIFAS